MKNLETEFKRVVRQIKKTQNQFQTLLKDGTFLSEARKYTEEQGREVKRLLKNDITKVKNFVHKERKELETFQKRLDQFQRNLPGEIKKIKTFINGQKREAEKFIKKMRFLSKRNAQRRSAGTNGSVSSGTSGGATASPTTRTKSSRKKAPVS